MDINEIEAYLNNPEFPSNREKVLEELLYLAIQNNSLLRVLLENQSSLNHKIDPSKTQDKYREEMLDQFKDADLEKFTSIMSRISNSNE